MGFGVFLGGTLLMEQCEDGVTLSHVSLVGRFLVVARQVSDMGLMEVIRRRFVMDGGVVVVSVCQHVTPLLGMKQISLRY